jgi:predicted anti-sigma-YlaC factor YlaD
MSNMTNEELSPCERVQMAAMAHGDGEPGNLTPDEVAAHLADCAGCRAAVAALAALQSPLNSVDYESLDVDVWPAVRQGIASEAPPVVPERRFVLGLGAALVLWRLAQLSIDLPAPVVNSIVPLALVVFVLWRTIGDPFAIQPTTNRLQREGV